MDPYMKTCEGRHGKLLSLPAQSLKYAHKGITLSMPPRTHADNVNTPALGKYYF